MSARVDTFPIDLLSDATPWPKGADAIFMSQFLDCFSPSQIVSLVTRARSAMDSNASLYILETFWDRQRHEAATFSLHNTSLYFTCLANGNSKMYHSREMKECVDAAGLRESGGRASTTADTTGSDHRIERISSARRRRGREWFGGETLGLAGGESPGRGDVASGPPGGRRATRLGPYGD